MGVFPQRVRGSVTGPENEKRIEARRTLLEAAAQYADAFDSTAGALCTGYVFVVELTKAEGRYCVWATGNGGHPDDVSDEGLDAWRVEGMVRQVLRDININNVTESGD